MAKKKGLPIAAPVNAAPKPDKAADKAMMERERKWEVEDALRTMQRAKELEKDKGLMRDVKKLANEQIKALKEV